MVGGARATRWSCWPSVWTRDEPLLCRRRLLAGLLPHCALPDGTQSRRRRVSIRDRCAHVPGARLPERDQERRVSLKVRDCEEARRRDLEQRILGIQALRANAEDLASRRCLVSEPPNVRLGER